ncbi:MAG: LLM class F420-dependent oxidoreductase, partial [Actinobacteria bacterium]|nr:LLM class F420-dependent oxidoreductase [Actinomycetota bacterium]
MQIGLVLPDHARWEDVVELALGAERLGVGSLWLSDLSDDRATTSAEDAIEPLMALAGLARVTAVTRLGVLL